MFQGNYNQQEEQGFPWQEAERHHGHHHGEHGHHGHHGQHGPQFEGPRGFGGYGRGPRFGGPRGQWGGPRFEGPRGPWGPGFGGPRGPQGPGFGGFGGYGRPEFTPEQQVLRSTAGEVMRLFAIAARSSMGNTERQGQLRSFLERARTELLGIIGDSKTAATQQEGQQAEQSNVEQV